FQRATANHRLDEACGLVEAITNWRVKSKSMESVRKIDHKMFFGKGKIEELTERIKTAKADGALDAVYLDVGRLSTIQYKELERLWDVRVLDRFGIVLQIFKERAKTGEAKMQVELAEIPYLKSRLVGDESVEYDQQRGGTHYIAGGGETQLEKERRVLSERETKLKKKLESLKKHRSHIRHERHKKHVPIVAIVGYTNAGNYNNNLNPSLQHSREDVVESDVVVHVRDVSHPDREVQKDDVISILRQQLKLCPSLLDNIIEVNNKVDLCSEEILEELASYSEPGHIEISALHGTGLDTLCSRIEQVIIETTGRMVKK
ncbi:hypothetical protein QZH41_014711, partial [Actinostola sp. cb2023]